MRKKELDVFRRRSEDGFDLFHIEFVIRPHPRLQIDPDRGGAGRPVDRRQLLTITPHEYLYMASLKYISIPAGKNRHGVHRLIAMFL